MSEHAICMLDIVYRWTDNRWHKELCDLRTDWREFLSGVMLDSFTFAMLPADDNGTMRYCADCDPSATLAACASIGAKTGAFAYRVAGAWKCMG